MDVKAIIPSIGRVVWYTPTEQDLAEGFIWAEREQKCAAIVCLVRADATVNLSVMDSHGRHFARQGVFVVQPGYGEEYNEGGGYCEWMPYQIKQAEKHG